jgi:sugar (pentulose or hexulose) kinase
MESHKRTELVDTLLEEARQMITALLKASTAPDMSREMSQGTAQGTLHPQEQYTIQDERRWWEEVFTHLTEARKALGQIEQAERHRGVGA